MSEVKHAVGPWQVMNDYAGATTVIANVDGETFPDGSTTFSYDFVCDTLPDDGDGSRSREIAVANARLIAAAPDLLRELKFQVRNCPVCKGTAKAVDVFDILSSDGPHEKKDCQRCSGARTAISKAEGRA